MSLPKRDLAAMKTFRSFMFVITFVGWLLLRWTKDRQFRGYKIKERALVVLFVCVFVVGPFSHTDGNNKHNWPAITNQSSKLRSVITVVKVAA